ncbi:receptor-like protein 1 [Cornus florida]|uniref:receptor-like protein 1 n=1 Tax=Cornus florida TaxID=4283 RepID=UPI002899F67C|nr:receptor-like protein 1 [Cornus florida]
MAIEHDIIQLKGLERSPSLNNLENLDLSYNLFNNDIWSFLQRLPSLKTLYMINLNVTVQSRDLHNLTNVENLFLDYATLSNDFLPSIQVMTSLKVLSLQRCGLTGTLPSTEFDQTLVGGPSFQLIGIHLSDREFGNVDKTSSTGAFPNFLYYQKDLQKVELSRVNFKGTFPNWLLDNNTRLVTLLLPNNSFTGPFQLPLLPKTGLLALDISKNHFYGNIPENIAMAFPGLEFLNMSLNDFGGTIASSLGDMSSLRVLVLSNNQLSVKYRTTWQWVASS